jgi:hypothetical protein
MDPKLLRLYSLQNLRTVTLALDTSLLNHQFAAHPTLFEVTQQDLAAERTQLELPPKLNEYLF